MFNYFNIKMKNIIGMFILGEGRVVWVMSSVYDVGWSSFYSMEYDVWIIFF